MAWLVEVRPLGESGWASNALRFATKAEAEEYAKELDSRWLIAKDLRAVECEDEVNYVFDFEAYRAVPLKA